MQTAPEVNDDGADFHNKDDDDNERDPEPSKFSIKDVNKADVRSSRSLRDANGVTPVRPRAVTPTTPVPTTPRRQLQDHNMIQYAARCQDTQEGPHS